MKGVPVRVRDIARVLVGYAPRLGIVGKDLEPDIVQGVVLMRYGGDSLKTIQGVHERVDYIRKNRLLPQGMDIEPYYDRAALVKLTTHTVLENLIVGMLLVTIVLWMFLGHTRAAIITAINIPLALMIAFIGMVGTGTPANLISLGAVDFGIVVDSTVIMVENIYRHLAEGPDARIDAPTGIARAEGFTGKLRIIFRAAAGKDSGNTARTSGDIDLVAWLTIEPRSQTLAQQNIFRCIVRPRTLHFPPRVSNPDTSHEICLAETELLGKICSEQSHLAVADVNSQRQHGSAEHQN